ncbi:MAG: MEDS domain-containing protein [Solirubrobacterales bacterium]|nr:MEDS domain-containing protein [Solirubrobacterales bacterium]
MAVHSPQWSAKDGEHVVQFYDDDADLIRAVGGYLSHAVSAGEAAVVIAGEAHRSAFDAELVGAGIDVRKAARDGSYVVLDAAETMRRFIHAGQIDANAFRDAIGGVVSAAQQGGRRVRAYGEMVALLWDAGHVLGAIELEKLWNELGRELRFALWCGYHIQSAAGEAHADALHEVCHLHTSVIDEASADFRAGPDAPFAARRFVTGVLARRPYGSRVSDDDVQLVVSELATNAVIHAGTPFCVSVRYDGSVFRISVHDWSTLEPIVRRPAPGAPSGRGLRLVSSVTRDWGIDPDPDGKTVWAELPVR